MPVRRKFLSLNALLFLIMATWLGVEFFWLPSIHSRLQSAISGRIQMSNVIASMNLTEKKFPHVISYINNNFEQAGNSEAQIQSEFTALISNTARHTGVSLKSLKYPGNRNKDGIKELVSSLEISGSFATIQNFISIIENDTRIIKVESLLVLARGDISGYRPLNSVIYDVKINLLLSKITRT